MRSSGGAYKPVFVGASDRLLVLPIVPKGASSTATTLGRTPSEWRGLGTHQGQPEASRTSRQPNDLPRRLWECFSTFQQRVQKVQEELEAVPHPNREQLATDLLKTYSTDLVAELRAQLLQLRHGGLWATDRKIQAEHDALCFCLAVWELVQEVAVNSFAPSAPRILQWYRSHFLEEDLAEWYQTALHNAEDLSSSSPLWEPLRWLALFDAQAEVLRILQPAAQLADPEVARFCHFLASTQSLQQLDSANLTSVEFNQKVRETRQTARERLREVPREHPVKKLWEVYAGSSQQSFDMGDDLPQQVARSWVEDFVLCHAWVFPDLRRLELGELLRSIASRRTAESIDDVDRVLFAAISLDVPELLRLLSAMPQRFPPFFVTHLVDVLYFAGRVPVSVEIGDRQLVPPRDWHLLTYAQELCRGQRAQMRLAIDYLRAGGHQSVTSYLRTVAERYCAAAADDAEFQEGLKLILELDFPELHSSLCRWRASVLRQEGHLQDCLRWACRAELGEGGDEEMQGHQDSSGKDHLSALVEELAAEDLGGLLAALEADVLEESVGQYPTEGLREALLPGFAKEEGHRRWPASKSLKFFAQLAHCRALREAGRPAAIWGPFLVRSLANGIVTQSLFRRILEEDLQPVLEEDPPVLTEKDVLLLMRQLQRPRPTTSHTQVSVEERVDKELHQKLGLCFSRAVLQGLGRNCSSFARLASTPLRHSVHAGI